MLTATCHCGAVRVEVPRKPRSLTNCDCSICRRYGTLWAYYKANEVRVTSAPGATGATAEYAWGKKSLKFIRCNTCGCVMNWERLQAGADSRMGVNARNFEPSALGPVRIRRLDGSGSEKYLD